MIQSKMRLQGILRTKAPKKGLFTLKQDDSNLAHDVAEMIHICVTGRYIG